MFDRSFSPTCAVRPCPICRLLRMQRYLIHTFGCQMNVTDTLRMTEVLSKLQLCRTEIAGEADLIVLNTCAIREKAEEKMTSALGRYRTVKLSRGALIGVGGCVAQQDKDRILKRTPWV